MFNKMISRIFRKVDRELEGILRKRQQSRSDLKRIIS